MNCPLEEYKEISPVFEQDIYEAISMKTCVEKRETYGAPGPKVHGADHCREQRISEK